MPIKTATRIRILASLLPLAATALSGWTGPIAPKNATVCSIMDRYGQASYDSCLSGGGDGCWECQHSSPDGVYTCWENADGTIGGCEPGDGSDGGP
jgi:hypothetical protein